MDATEELTERIERVIEDTADMGMLIGGIKGVTMRTGGDTADMGVLIGGVGGDTADTGGGIGEDATDDAGAADTG